MHFKPNPLHIRSSSIHTSLSNLKMEAETQTQQQQRTPLIEDRESDLSESLHSLETFLTVFGFCQSSILSFALSWVSFLILGFGLPLLIIKKSYCSNCEDFQIKSFELEILVARSLVAAISLLCVSHNLRKYGVRRFLFVDKCHGHMTQFRQEYICKIRAFFRLLAVWVFPCFVVKITWEVIRTRHFTLQAVSAIAGLVLSWTYSTVIYLSGGSLFNLVCNLQVIHFENYGKLLERDMEVSAYIEEHARLTHHLSKISHRFRIFLLLEFLVVTADQFMALLHTTGSRGVVNFFNGGDLVVNSIVEVAGIIICLHSAAKISHRAQALASVTTRWHALVTCNSDIRFRADVPNGGNDGVDGPTISAESDLESAEFKPVTTSTQTASGSSTSLYHKRQAFVTYVQSNLGGATIFGWTIDRVLVNTIFFIEMSLVLFVLGKTITFSTQ